MGAKKINLEEFIDEDGGLVRTIYLNSIAMANLTLADNSASEELKSIVEQIKKQQEVFYKAYNQ